MSLRKPNLEIRTLENELYSAPGEEKRTKRGWKIVSLRSSYGAWPRTALFVEPHPALPKSCPTFIGCSRDGAP